MNIIESTEAFEQWLRKQIPVVEADLEYKHERMRSDRFLFMRATFYRWMQLWPKICPKLRHAPVVSSVGDLHIENFGTWRDVEGRLVWGVNDFDEASPLPYPQDLVRVATSAYLATARIKVSLNDICLALIDGYVRSLEARGEPLVLGRKHHTLRQLALESLANPVDFWEKLEAKTKVIRSIPKAAREAISTLMPKGSGVPEWRVIIKPKGLGSLGRQRFVCFSKYHGEIIARETKTFVPSSVTWVEGEKSGGSRVLRTTIEQAVRSPDPYWTIRKGWQARRLSPDCRRIDLEDLQRADDVAYVIRAMGKETANVHLGKSKNRSQILKDLRKRPKDWLLRSVETMAEAVTEDWQKWCSRTA